MNSWLSYIVILWTFYIFPNPKMSYSFFSCLVVEKDKRKRKKRCLILGQASSQAFLYDSIHSSVCSGKLSRMSIIQQDYKICSSEKDLVPACKEHHLALICAVVGALFTNLLCACCLLH